MFTKSQITQYAHDYLSGSNQVPIGVLDSEFFKSECRRLWGPAEDPSKVEARKARHVKLLKKMTREQSKLLGPRGGVPKSGESRYKFVAYQKHIDVLRASI